MHSPKFPTKSADLKKIVKAPTLRAIWTRKVRNHLRGQLVPDPVEFLDFHLNLKQRTFEIESLVGSGEYQPRPIIRLRAEKSKGLCRQVALPSPEDALVLQALSDSLWEVVKNKAPSKNAFFAPEDQGFSKQNATAEEPDWGYGPIESWLDFQRTVLKFSQTKDYVVVTDIANYYDFILHSFLRAILADYAHEREHSLDLLLFVLDSMLWRPDYMPNYGIGMPQMSLDAPRLLAHTHLFEVDEVFASAPGIDFARYMDDMDFGVDNIATAKTVLRDLDLILQTRNLRLNNGKTKIMTRQEAALHFRIRDNIAVDTLNAKIDKASDVKRLLMSKALAGFVDRRLKDRYFDAGNGDKILKRLFRSMFALNARATPDTVRAILYEKPALRETLLRYWSHDENAPNSMGIMSGFLRSGQAVDDVSKLLITSTLVAVHTEVTISPADLDFLIDSFDRKNAIELFCRLWLISRYRDPAQLKAEIDVTNLIWSRHTFLNRTVAGFYGIFKATPHLQAYEKFVRKWGGPDAAVLLDFHVALANEQGAFNGIKKFVKAPNKTLPNQVSHSKTLVIASMLWNATIPKLERAVLLGNLPSMMADKYYQAQFSQIVSNAP